MVGAINSGSGFLNIDRLIARDITLQDDPLLRELIGVSRISRKYHSPDVRKENVMALLNQVHRNSKSPGNALVAENTALKLRELAYGTQAPPFYLLDANGDERTLSDYHDRFILLYFTRDNCNPCTYYYQSMDRIQKEFEGKLTIVIIAEQDGFKETVSFLRSRGFNWSVLDLGQDITFLEKYNIRTFPSLVLINPNGTMASANVPLPEEGLDLFIRRFMVRYEKQNPQIKKE
jgi:peroxiredoxin